MRTGWLKLLFLFSFAVRGEGPPVDEEGRVTVPHTLIQLNESQVEEMDALDSVTLTKEQWAVLRKVSPGTPKRLQGILPVTYNDCTCGFPWDALRMKDGRLAVLHFDQTPERLKWSLNGVKTLDLRVDRRGQFHLEGELVRFPNLVEAIRLSEPMTKERAPDPADGHAYVHVPVGMKATDAVFEDRILIIYRELAAKGWNGGEVPFWLEEG